MKTMTVVILVLLTTIVGPQIALAQTPVKRCVDDQQCRFVDEYIRELYEFHKVNVENAEDLKDSSKNKGDQGIGQFTSAIHGSTRFIQEARTAIGMLQEEHVSDQSTIDTLVNTYSQEIELHSRLIEIARTFLSGPKPGVDYGNLLADVAQIRARLEELTGQSLNMSNLVFGTELLDLHKQDKNGHVVMVITRSQRQELIQHINQLFGDRLNHLGNNANWAENGAWLLRAQLLKKFTAADDPIA